MSVISWGRQKRFAFSACGSLNDWVAPVVPAVFAVTYKRDPVNKPKSHTVLFFGESDDLSQNASRIQRDITDFWAKEEGTAEDFYIFVHPMNGSTKAERSRVQEKLVLEYQPLANRLND